MYGRLASNAAAEEAAEKTIRKSLQGVLRSRTHTHYGVAARTELGYLTVFVVVLQRRIVHTEPIPVRLRAGEAVRVGAKLADGYTKPTLHVTHTDGRVRTRQLSLGKDRSMSIPVACDSRDGVMRFEIMADGSGGPEVTANFPCGVVSSHPAASR